MKKILLSSLILCLSVLAFAQQKLHNISTTGNNLHALCFADQNYGYAVGDSGTILKTTDGGNFWTSVPSGTANELSSVCFPDKNTGYIVGNGGTILKTIDGGSKWEYIPYEMPLDFTSVFFTDANTGFTMDESASYLLKTINGGTSWTALKSDISNTTISSVYFTDQNTGFAVGGYNSIPIPSKSTGVLLRTTDGGASWKSIQFDKTTWLTSVSFTDTNTGYAVGGGGIILKTTDAGISWNTLLSGTTDWLSSVYFQDANTGYAVGGTILKTNDAGLTWNVIPGETNSILSSVYFPDADNGYVVGEYGTIIKITNVGETLSINEAEKTETAFSLYPSPAKNKITISSNSELPGEARVSIMNVSGKQLIKARFKNQKQIDIDVSTLSEGVYLVKIQTKAGIETKELLIQ